MIKLNRNIQPDINLVDKIDFFEPEVVKLNNGIPVYLIDTGIQDIIKIEFLFNAGSWYQDKLMVAKFTNKMLKEGTESYTSEEIAEKIDYYGAHLETSADKDMAYISFYSLNKHLDNTLPIIGEVIKCPVFPDNDLEIYKQNRKQEFIINNKKVRYLARRKFNELIFGKNYPYGRLFDEDDFDRIKRDDLINFFKDFYYPENCKIIIAGKIRKDMVNLLNRYFGGYNGSPQKINKKKIITIEPNISRRVHVKKDDAIQSAIRIGKVLFNKKHPDFLKLLVLNTVLGGYFGSRLMTNIREEKGYTYGIGSAVVSLHNSGYFFITSEIGNKVTQKAINEIYYEIKVLKEKKIPESELDIVRNYMLGSFLRSMDGAFALSDNLKGILEYGLDNSYNRNFIEIIKNISAEELRNLAQKYLDENSLFEMKVGK